MVVEDETREEIVTKPSRSNGDETEAKTAQTKTKHATSYYFTNEELETTKMVVDFGSVGDGSRCNGI